MIIRKNVKYVVKNLLRALNMLDLHFVQSHIFTPSINDHEQKIICHHMIIINQLILSKSREVMFSI